MASPRTTARPPGIFSRRYLTTTLGTTALVFLSAFESLAVTTVMPVVTEDLDGRGAYATAFSATLAASVLGMVAAGSWSDRRGPVRPLLTAVATFALGLLAAALAPTMEVFVAARFVQGLGAGAISVTLYVLVALVFPGPLRPAVFGAFAAAWVVPSMVGPFLAAQVAQTFSWHWVFGGVVVLVLAALVLVLPALRDLPGHAPGTTPPPARRAVRSFGAAALVAVAVVVLSSVGEVDGPARWVLAGGSLVVLVAAVRTLLPAGTLTARPGVPATVLLRGAIAATFFATEVYLPLLLHERYGLDLRVAGAVLTVAAVAWASASAVQGRLGDRLPHPVAMRAGTAALLVGVLTQLACAAFGLPPVVVGLGWFVAGAGMGLTFPRTTVLVLAQSAPGQTGAGSSALTISDASGGATALAATGLLFAVFGAVGPWAGFTATLTLCTALAVASVVVAWRVRVPAAP